MPACEKCWRDARGDPERYQELIRERAAGKVCTFEEQAGPAARWCPMCQRKTVHQYADRCLICGTEYRKETT